LFARGIPLSSSLEQQYNKAHFNILNQIILRRKKFGYYVVHQSLVAHETEI
jgi:hypothetical protein